LLSWAIFCLFFPFVILLTFELATPTSPYGTLASLGAVLCLVAALFGCFGAFAAHFLWRRGVVQFGRGPSTGSPNPSTDRPFRGTSVSPALAWSVGLLIPVSEAVLLYSFGPWYPAAYFQAFLVVDAVLLLALFALAGLYVARIASDLDELVKRAPPWLDSSGAPHFGLMRWAVWFGLLPAAVLLVGGIVGSLDWEAIGVALVGIVGPSSAMVPVNQALGIVERWRRSLTDAPWTNFASLPQFPDQPPSVP
jgi:hypothetical protein